MARTTPCPPAASQTVSDRPPAATPAWPRSVLAYRRVYRPLSLVPRPGPRVQNERMPPRRVSRLSAKPEPSSRFPPPSPIESCRGPTSRRRAAFRSRAGSGSSAPSRAPSPAAARRSRDGPRQRVRVDGRPRRLAVGQHPRRRVRQRQLQRQRLLALVVRGVEHRVVYARLRAVVRLSRSRALVHPRVGHRDPHRARDRLRQRARQRRRRSGASAAPAPDA